MPIGSISGAGISDLGKSACFHMSNWHGEVGSVPLRLISRGSGTSELGMSELCHMLNPHGVVGLCTTGFDY